MVLLWRIFLLRRQLYYPLLCLSLSTGLAVAGLAGLHLFKRSPLLLPKSRQTFVCPTPYHVIFPELLQPLPMIWQQPFLRAEETLQWQSHHAVAYQSWQQLLQQHALQSNSVRSLNDGQPYNLLWSKHALSAWEAYNKAQSETEKQVARTAITYGLPQISFPLISEQMPADVALKLWLHLGYSGWQKNALYLYYLGEVFQAGGLLSQAHQAWQEAQRLLQTELVSSLDISIKADLMRRLQQFLDQSQNQPVFVGAMIVTDRYRFSEGLPKWAVWLWLVGSLFGTSSLIYWLGIRTKASVH